MNTNGKPIDCPDRLAKAERRLRLVQGSVLSLMDERLRLAEVLESVSQAKTLDEARNIAVAALKE